jgi:hypothetical protein
VPPSSLAFALTVTNRPLLQGRHDMKLRIAVLPRGEKTPPATSRYADIRRARKKAFTVHSDLHFDIPRLSRHCISVLSPIDTAVFGLGPGQSIRWTEQGRERRLAVLEVRAPGVPPRTGS